MPGLSVWLRDGIPTSRFASLWRVATRSICRRLAAQVIEAFVNKQRRLDNNLQVTKKSAPVEVGAIWSAPKPGAAPGRCGPLKFAAVTSRSALPNSLRRWLLRRRIRAKRRGRQVSHAAFSLFHDFDWVLLGLVLALSVISVLEIYSATLHTKFVGFDRNQVLWLLGGMVAMFAILTDQLPPAAEHRGLGLWHRACCPGGRPDRGYHRCLAAAAGSSFPAASIFSRRSGSS